MFNLQTLGDFAFWIGLWGFLMLLLWISHKQYMAGHSNLFFSWRTREDKLLRQGQLMKSAFMFAPMGGTDEPADPE